MTRLLSQFFQVCQSVLVMRLTVVAILGLLVLTQLARPVQAATLQLLSIGNSITTGNFSSWSYVGENPVFVGKAAADSEVTITLNNAANTVTASSTGDWTFTPTTLIAGTHSVVISSGSEQKSFTLTIASSTSSSASTSTTTTDNSSATTSTSSTSSSTTELPKTGGVGLTWLVLIVGSTLVGFGLMGWSVTAQKYQSIESAPSDLP